MVNWLLAKWAARKKRLAEERDQRTIDKLKKSCPYCKLWKQGLQHRAIMSKSLFMPAMGLIAHPCPQHATEEDRKLYKEMRK